MLKLALAIMSITLSATTADNKLTPVQTTRYDHGLVAKSDIGDAALAAREMLVDVTYSDGRPRKGELLILFDSSSGVYLWEFSLAQLTVTASTMTKYYGVGGFVYAATDRLVFISNQYPSLRVHESLTKANNIDDAEAKALSEATVRLPAKLKLNTDDLIMINLHKVIPDEFAAACPLCANMALMKVLDIVHKGDTWEITLQGQWKEKITLNEKYEFTGHTRIN